MINVKVEANSNENSINLLKRFSRRVKGAGILPKVKSGRFRNRIASDFMKKKNRLRSIERKKQIEKMLKLGIAPKRKKRRF